MYGNLSRLLAATVLTAGLALGPAALAETHAPTSPPSHSAPMQGQGMMGGGGKTGGNGMMGGSGGGMMGMMTAMTRMMNTCNTMMANAGHGPALPGKTGSKPSPT
ncbi:MAG: hypothetical protein M0Z28_10630 [Rhodospirillales bacterium]|nr:hypothetical protein [Rhodospirillales bacterium]